MCKKCNDLCDKCGNPNKMYWCNTCQCNCEKEVCDNCMSYDNTEIDEFYHDNCNEIEKE